MNTTDPTTKALVIRGLIDGMGVRATSRLTGVAKGTVLRILNEAGDFCAVLPRTSYCGTCRPVGAEADEHVEFLWGRNSATSSVQGHGDLWTFRGD